MDPHIGFALYYATKLFNQQERLFRLAMLISDDRWPWPLQYAKLLSVPGYRPEALRKLPSGAAELVEAMSSPRSYSITLLNSPRRTEHSASITIDTGQDDSPWNGKYPFHADGQTIAGHGKSLSRWVSLVHDLAQETKAIQGIICIWPTSEKVLTDVTLTRVGKGLPEPYEEQRRRAVRWRAELGATIFRYPRWGTYLPRAFVNNVCGVQSLNSLLGPESTVLELGDLVFIQLTRSPENAVLATYEDRLQKLETTLADYLTPPIPS